MPNEHASVTAEDASALLTKLNTWRSDVSSTRKKRSARQIEAVLAEAEALKRAMRAQQEEQQRQQQEERQQMRARKVCLPRVNPAPAQRRPSCNRPATPRPLTPDMLSKPVSRGGMLTPLEDSRCLADAKPLPRVAPKGSMMLQSLSPGTLDGMSASALACTSHAENLATSYHKKTQPHATRIYEPDLSRIYASVGRQMQKNHDSRYYTDYTGRTLFVHGVQGQSQWKW